MSSLATSSFWFEGEADVMGIYFRMEPSYGGHSADWRVDVTAFKNHNHESQDGLSTACVERYLLENTPHTMMKTHFIQWSLVRHICLVFHLPQPYSY